MIIGTFAYCGSGQDTLADGFCQYKGFTKFSLGDVVRSIADEMNMPHNRKTLQHIREQYDLIFGRTFFAEKIIQEIKLCSNDKIIITGIRTLEEYFIFKKKFNMVLVFVQADENIRFRRMLKRSDEKDEKNIQLLRERMYKEEKMFDYKKLIHYADFIFDFNMNLNCFLKNEKAIIYEQYKKITSKTPEVKI